MLIITMTGMMIMRGLMILVTQTWMLMCSLTTLAGVLTNLSILRCYDWGTLTVTIHTYYRMLLQPQPQLHTMCESPSNIHLFGVIKAQ